MAGQGQMSHICNENKQSGHEWMVISICSKAFIEVETVKLYCNLLKYDSFHNVLLIVL